MTDPKAIILQIQKRGTHALPSGDYQKLPEYIIWKTIETRASHWRDQREQYPHNPIIGIKNDHYWLHATLRDFESFYRQLGPLPGPEYALCKNKDSEGYTPENLMWRIPDDDREWNSPDHCVEYAWKKVVEDRIKEDITIREYDLITGVYRDGGNWHVLYQTPEGRVHYIANYPKKYQGIETLAILLKELDRQAEQFEGEDLELLIQIAKFTAGYYPGTDPKPDEGLAFIQISDFAGITINPKSEIELYRPANFKDYVVQNQARIKFKSGPRTPEHGGKPFH